MASVAAVLGDGGVQATGGRLEIGDAQKYGKQREKTHVVGTGDPFGAAANDVSVQADKCSHASSPFWWR